MTQEIVVTEHVELLDAVDDDQTEIRETFPLPVIDNVVVVATSPAEMRNATSQLVAWGESRVNLARSVLDDAKQKLARAKQMKQNSASYKAAVASAEDDLVFYEKIKTALEQGYCIVPNFPAVDVLAVRIRADRTEPTQWDHESYLGVNQQNPDKLPAGEGRYVSPDTRNTSELRAEGTEKDPDKKVRYAYPVSFREVTFPARLAKMKVLDQLDTAQRKLIFDDIGLLPAAKKRHPDPIILGRIHSHLGSPKNRTVSFMIAWWIDTATL